jgi:hypothetical protein
MIPIGIFFEIEELINLMPVEDLISLSELSVASSVKLGTGLK